LTWQGAVFYFQLIFNSADHTSAQLQVYAKSTHDQNKR